MAEIQDGAKKNSTRLLQVPLTAPGSSRGREVLLVQSPVMELLPANAEEPGLLSQLSNSKKNHAGDSVYSCRSKAGLQCFRASCVEEKERGKSPNFLGNDLSAFDAREKQRVIWTSAEIHRVLSQAKRQSPLSRIPAVPMQTFTLQSLPANFQCHSISS